MLNSSLTPTISTPKWQALIRNSVVEKNGDQNAAGKVALLCSRDLSVHALRAIVRNKKKLENYLLHGEGADLGKHGNRKLTI